MILVIWNANCWNTPLYSLDLTNSNSYLLPKLNRSLESRRFFCKEHEIEAARKKLFCRARSQGSRALKLSFKFLMLRLRCSWPCYIKTYCLFILNKHKITAKRTRFLLLVNKTTRNCWFTIRKSCGNWRANTLKIIFDSCIRKFTVWLQRPHNTTNKSPLYCRHLSGKHATIDC